MAANPLRMDPSRTTMLRRSFCTAMRQRFGGVRRAVAVALLGLDVFGLKPAHELVTHALPQPRAFVFGTDAEKVGQFQQWLQGEIDSGILVKDWTNAYIKRGYDKGVENAYAAANRLGAVGGGAFYLGGKAQFLRDSFNAQESIERLQLLYTRSFEYLRGVTQDMSRDLSIQLTNGFSRGTDINVIAKEMASTIDGLTQSRALTIARTEIIHAHAEGQLDSFERLGMNDLQLAAEWVTAGGACPKCSAMAGRVYTIKEARGLIPFHPNCRCAWVPVLR